MKPERLSCERTRLAEGDVAVVDTCDCGLLQVHLGALTLRLTPDAVTSLLVTLEQALTVYEARSHGRGARALAQPPRGHA